MLGGRHLVITLLAAICSTVVPSVAGAEEPVQWPGDLVVQGSQPGSVDLALDEDLPYGTVIRPEAEGGSHTSMLIFWDLTRREIAVDVHWRRPFTPGGNAAESWGYKNQMKAGRYRVFLLTEEGVPAKVRITTEGRPGSATLAASDPVTVRSRSWEQRVSSSDPTRRVIGGVPDPRGPSLGYAHIKPNWHLAPLGSVETCWYTPPPTHPDAYDAGCPGGGHGERRVSTGAMEPAFRETIAFRWYVDEQRRVGYGANARPEAWPFAPDLTMHALWIEIDG